MEIGWSVRAREELDMAGPAAPHCDVATDRKKATRTYLTILMTQVSDWTSVLSTRHPAQRWMQRLSEEVKCVVPNAQG